MRHIAVLKRLMGRPVVIVAAVLVLGFAAVIAWVLISGSHRGEALLDLTLEQLENDVRNNPQSVQSRLAVAIAYTARGYNAVATEQFQEILKLDKQNQTAMIGLGRIYLQEGKVDQAQEMLLAVAERNKDNPFKRTIEQLEAVYYDLGTIYSRKGDYKQAADYLNQALEINPVDADALYMLGKVQYSAGDFEAALAAYQRAVLLAPDFADAYRAMGEAYGRLGNKAGEKYARGMVRLADRSFDDAIRDLQEAVTSAPNLAEAHMGLGLALEARGRTKEALASYQRAQELDSGLLLAQLGARRLASSGGTP